MCNSIKPWPNHMIQITFERWEAHLSNAIWTMLFHADLAEIWDLQSKCSKHSNTFVGHCMLDGHLRDGYGHSGESFDLYFMCYSSTYAATLLPVSTYCKIYLRSLVVLVSPHPSSTLPWRINPPSRSCFGLLVLAGIGVRDSMVVFCTICVLWGL